MTQLDLNPRFQQALDLLEDSNEHLFITGKAGTGKSTLLDLHRSRAPANMVVLAPTGVAALNVLGQTIHSFFAIRPGITPEKAAADGARAGRDKENKFKHLETLVIDEVSMVRAELMDCVDLFLQNARRRPEPFGGVRMVLFGDLYQLPPVVRPEDREYFSTVYPSPFFFDSRAMRREEFSLRVLELDRVYRQHEEDFIELLNAIRDKSVTRDQLLRINQRVDPARTRPERGAVYLTTTNDLADAINHQELAALPGEAWTFTASDRGEFPESWLPTTRELTLKIGAQVMFLNNDADRRWVNGTLGEVLDFEIIDETTAVLVRQENGDEDWVTPHTWEMYRSFYDKDEKRLEQESVGAYTQMPLRLAWAVTIHKAQGKTFSRVVIDFGRGAFASGQAYVALSRCRTFQGITLKKPLKPSDVRIDFRVSRFLTEPQYAKAERETPLDARMRMIEDAIEDGRELAIVYLKPNNQKSRRVIRPLHMGEMEYQGTPFVGLRAWCLLRREERSFRVDRILELSEVAKS